MATPLKPFWPCQIAWYPIFSNSSAGKASSAHLISCRQATAGRRSSSHSISRGRRALVPLMLKDAIRIPWVLDAEAGTATATRGGVRILDLERRAAERFDEIDRAPFDQLEAHRIDDQFHAVRFAHGVPGVRRVGQVELVLEARAAAALDREAQDGRAALLARDRVHAGRCCFGKGKRLSHASPCRDRAHSAQAVRMYSRITWASCSTCSSRFFTRSPIDTNATSSPPSSTGRWRIRRKVITSSASRTVECGSAVIGGAVITSPTSRSSASSPCSEMQ